jgi:glutathione S-transferase
MADASASASASPPLVFYDIASGPPIQPYAPNPSKARYALNFKAVPYATRWVPLPDIPAVRTAVGAPTVRKFADGTNYHTLPILTDASTGAIIGDSFDIAIYLQDTYPTSGGGNLFPDIPLDYDSPFIGIIPLVPLSDEREGNAVYAKFNRHIDATFTAHVVLCSQGMPFEVATAAATKAEFARRAGVDDFATLDVQGEPRAKLLVSFRDSLAPLAELLRRDARGVWIAGEVASYADFIIGGWLRMARVCLPADEWAAMREWHGGVWGALFDALEQYADAK